MPDSDKWIDGIQWWGNVGVAVGSAIATYIGLRLAKKPSIFKATDDPSNDRTIAELVLEARLRDSFEKDLKNTRAAFYAESKANTAAYQKECGDLETRLREVETSCRVLRSEFEAFRSRRKT